MSVDPANQSPARAAAEQGGEVLTRFYCIKVGARFRLRGICDVLVKRSRDELSLVTGNPWRMPTLDAVCYCAPEDIERQTQDLP